MPDDNYIVTNRCLVERITDLLGDNPPALSYNFKKVAHDVVVGVDGDPLVEIEVMNPEINEDIVPPIHIFEMIGKRFIVQQPEDFISADEEFYIEHFPFIFEDVDAIEDNIEIQYVDSIQTDEPELNHPQTIDIGGDVNDNFHVRVILYESDNRDDDRVIIITETRSYRDNTRTINFFDGEEVTDIDIDDETQQL